MQCIRNDPGLTLQIIVTGMHLSPEFGSTYKEIVKAAALSSGQRRSTIKSIIIKSIIVVKSGLRKIYESLKNEKKLHFLLKNIIIKCVFHFVLIKKNVYKSLLLLQNVP